jgi:hypothetical protein
MTEERSDLAVLVGVIILTGILAGLRVSWWIVCLPIGIVALLVSAAALVFVLLGKKHYGAKGDL